jgi:hypothetical protein
MQDIGVKKVKAALLGLQHPHSRLHLRTLKLLPEVEEIRLWDPDADLLAQVQATQGDKVAATFTDLSALLADDDLCFVGGAQRPGPGGLHAGAGGGTRTSNWPFWPARRWPTMSAWLMSRGSV